MKHILITLMLLITFSSYSQEPQDNSVLIYRAENMSLRSLVDGEWEDWSEIEPINVLITIDYENQVIKYYNAGESIFYITISGKIPGSEIYSFICVDKDGIECSILIAKKKRLDGTMGLIMITQYKKIELAYYLKGNI